MANDELKKLRSEAEKARRTLEQHDASGEELRGAVDTLIAFQRELEEEQLIDPMLRGVLETTSDGVWDYLLDEDKLLLSKGFGDLVGQPAESLSSGREKLKGVIHPDDISRVRSRFSEYLEGGGEAGFRAELRLRNGEGLWQWVLSRGLVTARDKKGVPTRVLGNVSVLERPRTAVHALPGSAELFSQLFEGGEVIKIIAEVDSGELIDANPAATRLLLGPDGQHDGLAGKHITDLVPEDLRHAFRKRLSEANNLLDALPYTTDIETSEGDRVPVEIFGYEIHLQGKTYAHCKLRELAVRQQAERALLASSRLETTDTIAGGMAHDINDLMTGVLGYAELLARASDLSEDTRNMLGAITAAAGRAGGIAQQLLAFSRKESDLHLAPVELGEIVKDTSRLLWKSTRQRIKYDLQLDEDLAAIYADPGQIRRIVTSIIKNAIESIEDEGRIVINSEMVTLKKRSRYGTLRLEPGTWVALSIQDEGTGMDPEVLANVFEPFFSTKYRGRGMGLASAKMIVERHSGRIGIESGVGRGTKVTLVFPPWSGEQAPAPEQLEPEEVMGDETVMIIDDDEAVTDVIKRMLEMHGYTVLVAYDGLSSIRLAESHEGPIHLALLDMTMPVMSGVTAFPLLRDVHPEMKVIVSSGHQYNEAVQELLDKGASTFLQKPISPQLLIQKIRNTLDGPAVEPVQVDDEQE